MSGTNHGSVKVDNHESMGQWDEDVRIFMRCVTHVSFVPFVYCLPIIDRHAKARL